MGAPRVTNDAQDNAIRELVWRGVHSQKKMQDMLFERDLISIDEDGNYSVSEKTIGRRIKNILREGGPPDTSGVWSIVGAPEGEARRVGDVFAFVADQSSFRVWLTRDLARYVVRIREAAPDVPAPWAYALARALRACEAPREPYDMDPIDTRLFDMALSARPWESPERAAWFTDLLQTVELHTGDQLRSLSVSIRLLADASPGSMVGSFGNPWPALATPEPDSD